MNAIEKVKIKEYLETQKKRTILKINDLKDLTQPIEPDCAIGRVSRMDAIVNSAVNKEALYKLEEKLHKINITLADIHEKDFGLCTRCKKEIPVQRIISAPGGLCISCSR